MKAENYERVGQLLRLRENLIYLSNHPHLSLDAEGGRAHKQIDMWVSEEKWMEVRKDPLPQDFEIMCGIALAVLPAVTEAIAKVDVKLKELGVEV